ncbi:MAG: gamma-glutamyl-gamma-aminobutyrate hydrolase family protein [Hyphomicrobiaceae bacterium]|nr:gamma-glutamyl-gamma-aminobutyrate hydrolase family protein [Hyphomicrobiaceae bacterium]
MDNRVNAKTAGLKLDGKATQPTDNNSCRARTNAPILLLLHQKNSSPGAVGRWLQKQGFELQIKHPTEGEELPENLEDYGGLIVFGGPMSANDDCPEIKREINWLTQALEQSLPYLGICLGAQMMIRQLGGTISKHDKGMVEIGYRRVEATPLGKALIPHWPERFFQWHGEGFDLPAGTTALAHGQRFENQSFSYGKHVFGVQFHPEVTSRIIERWTINAHDMLNKKGAHLSERLRADHQKYKNAQRLWLDHFMHHWTSLIEDRT